MSSTYCCFSPILVMDMKFWMHEAHSTTLRSALVEWTKLLFFGTWLPEKLCENIEAMQVHKFLQSSSFFLKKQEIETY